MKKIGVILLILSILLSILTITSLALENNSKCEGDDGDIVNPDKYSFRPPKYEGDPDDPIIDVPE